MFEVLFEVHPHGDQWDAYLDYAKMLRPELENIDGFVDNIRYRSLTRDGWILSLSSWRDEKALVRWRTHAGHHDVQTQGREQVLADYHLRVGQITRDSHVPDGQVLVEQRLDETQTGDATTITLCDAHRAEQDVTEAAAEDIAGWLGLNSQADGLIGWDVYEAVLTPGDVTLMLSWRCQAAAEAFELAPVAEGTRTRRVRVIRDYGMYDRRENPQYYPDIQRPDDGGASDAADRQREE